MIPLCAGRALSSHTPAPAAEVMYTLAFCTQAHGKRHATLTLGTQSEPDIVSKAHKVPHDTRRRVKNVRVESESDARGAARQDVR